jgi:hypothetical protein
MKHVYVVQTNPVEGKEDEYNDWYEHQHLDDILRLPGFVSAQRFRLADTDPAQSAAQRYLAIYEIETDDINAVNMTMVAAAGGPSLPLSDALDLSNFSGAYFEAIGEKVTRDSAL